MNTQIEYHWLKIQLRVGVWIPNSDIESGFMDTISNTKSEFMDTQPEYN
jgi:hypothetical protein